MGVKVGPEFQSEEGGSVQSFGLKNMALKPNYF